MKEPKTKVFTGELDIGGVIVPCYVTPDERRILSGRGVANLLGLTDEGEPSTRTPGSRIKRLFGYIAFKPILEAKLGLDHLNDIKLKMGGKTYSSFDAPAIVDLCDAILEVRNQKPAPQLTERQEKIIGRAEMLIRTVAKVGIIALVDEATGYQYYRDRSSLETILNRLIADELQPWTKTFPDEYYAELFDKFGLRAPRGSTKRPMFFANLTIDLVYDRLAIPGGLYTILKDKSTDPVTRKRNRNKLFQWLTKEDGKRTLDRHLWSLVYGMKGSSNWAKFMQWLERAHPKFDRTMSLFVKEEDEE
jgi:hypothetical protein